MTVRPPYGVGGDGEFYYGEPVEPAGVLNSHHDVNVGDMGTSLIEMFNGDIEGEKGPWHHGGNRSHFYQSQLLTHMLDKMKGMEERGNYSGTPFYYVFYSLNNCVKGYKILYFVMDQIESIPVEKREDVLLALHMTIRDISFRMNTIVCGDYVRRVGAEDPQPSLHDSEAVTPMPVGGSSSSDNPSGGGARLGSRMSTSHETKFTTTLHLLNRMLDTTSAGL
jgi:hypothetical protein